MFFSGQGGARSPNKRMGAEPLVHPSDRRQEMELGACLTYEGGLTLCFNWTAPGSREFDSAKTIPPQHVWGTSPPDRFVPILRSITWPLLILDAKNKGLRSNALYGAQEDGTLCKPKPEDLVKMHAYRDAIDAAQGAFALFPGTESRLYPAHKATQPWNGIGALALRPDTSGRPEPSRLGTSRRSFGGSSGPSRRSAQSAVHRALCQEAPILRIPRPRHQLQPHRGPRHAAE